MKTTTELTENGRQQFDSLQVNLSRTTSMTDAELEAEPDAMDDLFGKAQRHPEDRREEARKLQDRMLRQGREAYAREYAETQIKNYQQ